MLNSEENIQQVKEIESQKQLKQHLIKLSISDCVVIQASYQRNKNQQQEQNKQKKAQQEIVIRQNYFTSKDFKGQLENGVIKSLTLLNKHMLLKLKEMNLQHCQISSIDCFNRIYLPQLKILSLQNNYFTSMRPSRRFFLPKLEQINVARSHILQGIQLQQAYVPMIKSIQAHTELDPFCRMDIRWFMKIEGKMQMVCIQWNESILTRVKGIKQTKILMKIRDKNPSFMVKMKLVPEN